MTAASVGEGQPEPTAAEHVLADWLLGVGQTQWEREAIVDAERVRREEEESWAL